MAPQNFTFTFQLEISGKNMLLVEEWPAKPPSKYGASKFDFHFSFVNQVDKHSVGGIMVSIAAFQAVDPGSIPGRRKFFFFSSQDLNPGCWEQVHPFQGYFHI